MSSQDRTSRLQLVTHSGVWFLQPHLYSERVMTIWDKVKEGIDKAGKAAQDVIDDGKTRIDAYRAREQADKAAEALGYAVFRALELGQELEGDSKDRLMRSLRDRDTEAKRLEGILASESAAKPASPPAAETHPEAPAASTPAEGAAPNV